MHFCFFFKPSHLTSPIWNQWSMFHVMDWIANVDWREMSSDYPFTCKISCLALSLLLSLNILCRAFTRSRCALQWTAFRMYLQANCLIRHDYFRGCLSFQKVHAMEIVFMKFSCSLLIQVGHCYPKHLADFPQQLKELLSYNHTVLDADLRMV